MPRKPAILFTDWGFVRAFYQLFTSNVDFMGDSNGYLLRAQISGAASGINHSILIASGGITFTGYNTIFVNNQAGGPISSGSSFSLLQAQTKGIDGDFTTFSTNVSGLQENKQNSPYVYWNCFMP